VAADKSETLLEHAKREMEEAYARANKLREVYYALGGGEKEERDRFLGLQRWRAIHELLREKPEQKQPSRIYFTSSSGSTSTSGNTLCGRSRMRSRPRTRATISKWSE
jgi:hypothetical protein